MTTSTLFALILVAIILLAWLVCWLIHHFGPMNEEEKGIYEKEYRKPFECPYDLESCDYIDTSTMTIGIQCQDCKRYNHGIRPSVFDKRSKLDDKLTKKALNEKELRDKVKKITDKTKSHE